MAVSLDSLCQGAVNEKFNLAMSQVARNIIDPNVPGTGKRVITIKLTFESDEKKRHIKNKVDVNVKLVPPKCDETLFFVGQDIRTGMIEMQEDGTAGKIRCQGISDTQTQVVENGGK